MVGDLCRNFCITAPAWRTGTIAAMTRRLNLIFGLFIGVMWMGEIIFGNLGDTTVLGNFRTFHFHAYRVVGWSFISGAVLLTGFAGLFGAYRSCSIHKGLSVGVWSGLISGAMTFTTIMVLTILFRNALLLAPSNVKEFAGSAEAMFGNAFWAGFNHMWIGPLLGVTLGGVGAVAGKWLCKLLFVALA